jgi:hydrogenase maturation factor
VDATSIPVRPATRALCDALGVDPLRLISSGALLIACPDGLTMVKGLRAQGIGAVHIGRMTERGRLLVHPDGLEEAIDHLERDELYRVLG